MNTLKDYVRDSVEISRPSDTYSFLQGFLMGAEAFAVWKDGEQVLGSGIETVKTLKEAVKQFVEEQGAKHV